jgi:tetratricopeptide (TPR) repeat protein
MGISLNEWAKRKSDELTFIQLREGTMLGRDAYKVPPGGIYVPMLTMEMARRIQMVSEDEVVTVPSIIRGILFLLGIDPEFKFKSAYIEILESNADDVKAVAVDTAKELEKEGDFSRAVLILRGYQQFEPENNQTLIILGALYVKFAGSLENPEDPLIPVLMKESLSLLEKSYPENQKDTLLPYYLGIVYQWQKTYLKAEKIWQQALHTATSDKEKQMLKKKIQQNDLLARYEEGYQLILHGKPTAGLDQLLPLLERDPEWWNLHFFIAMGYQQQGLLQEAIRHYGKVLEIKGFHQQTAIELSEIYLARGENEKAMQWMEEILLQNPGQSEMLCRMALMKAMTGNIRESFDMLTQAEDAGGDEKLISGVRDQINAIANN